MEDDKAPSPDGFPTNFLKVGWEVVEKEVMAVFVEFHSKNCWCKSLNATFIMLIPKKLGASELKDFRPISLVGCIYKLLIKALAILFKASLAGVIS